jgi:hypothetical protein
VAVVVYGELMAKKVWIVEYQDNNDKKSIRLAADDAEKAEYRVLERFPHVIIKSVREARPSERLGPQ